MEGLLSRIALAEEEQRNKEKENRMRAFNAIESRDTASRKSLLCLSWVKKKVKIKKHNKNSPASGLMSLFSEMDMNETKKNRGDEDSP